MQRASLIKRRCENLPKHAVRLQLAFGALGGHHECDHRSRSSLSRGSRAFFMKKGKLSRSEMRREYKRSDFRKGVVRGKYAKKARLSKRR